MDLGAILAYSLSHQKSVYASIASSMFKLARALCTEEVDRVASQIEVKKKLEKFGYPPNLIKRQLRRALVPQARKT